VLRWLVWCLAAFAGLLGVAATAVVAAETAVIAETRREQVRVMRLVGASATFVRLSFLAQWLLVALVASGAGLAGLWALVAAANARRGLLPGRLAGLALVGPAEVAHLAPLLLAGAAAACLVAATLALPRH
jgi:cell division transport system permease protein